MEIFGQDITFAPPPPKHEENFRDLMYDGPWGKSVLDHAPLLVVETDPASNTAKWKLKPEEFKQAAKALLLTTSLFTPVANGDRSVENGQSVEAVSKLLFGDEAGARLGAQKKVAEAFNWGKAVATALPRGEFCYVASGYVFYSTSEDDARTHFEEETEPYARKQRESTERAKNAQVKRANWVKDKVPALAGEVDDRMKMVDAQLGDLTVLGRLLPALERANGQNGGSNT